MFTSRLNYNNGVTSKLRRALCNTSGFKCQSFGFASGVGIDSNITPNFRGVWPIIATPFKSSTDESIDFNSFERIINFFGNDLSSVCNGLTIIGVLGESNRLTDSERSDLIKVATNISNNTPICVGTSHAGTHATIKLTEQALDNGASCVMITPSKEPVPNDLKIYQYYENISNYFINCNVNVPIVLQDHPASTQVHISYDLLLNIIKKNSQLIRCIKLESLPSPPKIRKLRKDINENEIDVTILTGLGALYGIFDLEAGCDGFMTGFAFPEILYAMQNEYINNKNYENARMICEKYLPLIVFEQQPGIGVRKEIYKMRGLLDNTVVRHPGASATQDAREQLES